jgi:hypothetical protein
MHYVYIHKSTLISNSTYAVIRNWDKPLMLRDEIAVRVSSIYDGIA